MKRRWSPEVKALSTAIEDSLAKTFGFGTHEYNRHLPAATLDKGSIGMDDDSPHDIVQFHEEGKSQSLALLQQVVRGLTEDLQDNPPPPAPSTQSTAPVVQLSDEIFVVHGRDEAAKVEVARLMNAPACKRPYSMSKPTAAEPSSRSLRNTAGRLASRLLL